MMYLSVSEKERSALIKNELENVHSLFHVSQFIGNNSYKSHVINIKPLE